MKRNTTGAHPGQDRNHGPPKGGNGKFVWRQAMIREVGRGALGLPVHIVNRLEQSGIAVLVAGKFRSDTRESEVSESRQLLCGSLDEAQI